MTRFLWRWLKSRRGNAAIEFALTAPILLIFAGGIVEFGRAFQVYVAANRLASQYAMTWSDCSDSPSGTCQTELGYYTTSSAVTNIAPQLQSSKLTLTMFEVQMSGTTPTIVYSYPSSASLTAAQTSAAQAAFSSSQVGVIVTVTYAHSLAFFQSLMTPFLGSHLTVSYTITQLKS